MAVVKASDQDFQEQVKKHDKVVVKYFANWCGMCKMFAPKYKRISEEEDHDDVLFLDVNAEESPEARKMAGVSNLPYLAAFKNGELVEGSPSNKEEYLRKLVSATKA